MGAGFFGILGVGFLLGMRHAAEPDHVVAVSTIAARSNKLWRAALTGAFWGIGHTFTLFVVGLLLLGLKREIPQRWSLTFEFGVGVMLVYLGVASLWRSRRTRRTHVHPHEHNGHTHVHHHGHEQSPDHEQHSHATSYWRPTLVGMMHGMAGSAAMVVLTMSVAGSIWEAAVYIICFGLGTVAGMLVNTTVIGLPFIMTSNRAGVHETLVRVSGWFSVAFGFYYMYAIGFGEGLFRLWAA